MQGWEHSCWVILHLCFLRVLFDYIVFSLYISFWPFPSPLFYLYVSVYFQFMLNWHFFPHFCNKIIHVHNQMNLYIRHLYFYFVYIRLMIFSWIMQNWIKQSYIITSWNRTYWPPSKIHLWDIQAKLTNSCIRSSHINSQIAWLLRLILIIHRPNAGSISNLYQS